jgi:hypothetical protein
MGDLIHLVQTIVSTGMELLLLCLVASVLRLIYVIKHTSIATNGDLGENPELVLTANVGPVESTMAVPLGETTGGDGR